MINWLFVRLLSNQENKYILGIFHISSFPSWFYLLFFPQKKRYANNLHSTEQLHLQASAILRLFALHCGICIFKNAVSGRALWLSKAFKLGRFKAIWKATCEIFVK